MDEKSDQPTTQEDSVKEEPPPAPPTASNNHGSKEVSTVQSIIILGGLCLAIFLMALDISLIGTAIPKLTSAFHATDEIGWYGTAYIIPLCVMQPLAGKIYANFSKKIIFLGFIVLFEIGSLLCALSTSRDMFLGSRAIGGIGGAGIFAGGMIIISEIMPLRRRPMAIAILQSFFGLAVVVGPLIGGALTEHVTWRWCFYINLPAGAFTVAVIIFFFHPPSHKLNQETIREKLMKLDLVGAALFAPGMIMLLLALQWGGTTFAWNSSRIIGLFVGSGCILILFVLWQYHQGDKAMIPRSIFCQRTVLAASMMIFFYMSVYFTCAYFLPQWFQVVKGASPQKSGVMFLPVTVAQIIAGYISSGIITKIGYANPLMLLGTSLQAIGAGLVTTFHVNSGSQYWIGYQVLIGFGTGTVIATPFIAANAAVSPKQIPIATSIVSMFQYLGGSIFLSVDQAIFSNSVRHSLKSFHNQALIDNILKGGATSLKSIVSPDELPEVLAAYNKAVTKTFYLACGAASAAFISALFIEWKSVKRKPQKDGNKV